MKIEILVGLKGGIKNHCLKCDYTSRDKYDWKRHLSTRKHTMDNKDKSKKKKQFAYHCMKCGRTYKYQSGLSKHLTKCPIPSQGVSVGEKVVEKNTTPVGKNIILTVKNRDEEKESLKKEIKQLNQLLQEMIKTQGETNKYFHKTLNSVVGKVGNHVTNNKMSINVYLNQHCKDAMNLTEFVSHLKVTMEDLLYTKNHGYVKGISNIFVKQLKDMKPTERPIHCSDKKRLQFYVKDQNKWEKDKIHSKIDKSINDITIKQIQSIKNWEKKHPNYLMDDILLSQWHMMIYNAMGGEDKNKNKDSIKKELSIASEVNKFIDMVK